MPLVIKSILVLFIHGQIRKLFKSNLSNLFQSCSDFLEKNKKGLKHFKRVCNMNTMEMVMRSIVLVESFSFFKVICGTCDFEVTELQSWNRFENLDLMQQPDHKHCNALFL